MSAPNYPAAATTDGRPAAECNSVGAVIDIGSNSVKLLVGQVRGTTVERIYSIGESIKLGQGAFQTRRLQPNVIERVAGTVAEFVQAASKFSPAVLRILATSAVREAINRADFVRAVEARAQKRVAVLSGEEEAELLFEGVRREPGLAGSPLMVVDIGGGSTQVIVSESGAGELYYSFPFGSLRLLETLGLSGVLSQADLAKCRLATAIFVQHQMIPAIGRTGFEIGAFDGMRLIGTGRKLRKLASAPLPNQADWAGEPPSLTAKRLTFIIEQLWGMSRTERAARLAIAEANVDVALAGAITLEAILQRFGFELLHTSDGNLRKGAILKWFGESQNSVATNWRMA
jgi:exopolyphosphatase/guanosine-5'-triphosphate,3'-diphosphate pyrophosphatase